MLNSEIKNHLNTKEVAIPNQLDIDNCLFTPELLNVLIRSYKNKSTYLEHSNKSHRKVIKNIKGIYIIAFNIFNKKDKIIIYNYIYYNDLLYLTLIVYFMTRNFFINKDDHEWGKYLVILDNKFLDYNYVNNYIDLYNNKDKARNKY